MTMFLRAGVAVACVLAFASAVSASELKVTMHDGRVTIIADNVPVRQILAEWARVGQTRIVGADKLPGGPVTLLLEGVPERQALDILLRAASGFMVAERPEPVATLARFDRIMILPTSSAPTGTQAAAPAVRGRAGAINSPSPAMAPQAPVAEEVVEADPEPDNAELSNDNGERPAETNFDYANPQQFLQRRLEQLQQQQSQGQAPSSPTMFPGTASPFGQAGTATATTPTGVPGIDGVVTSTRPGEIVKVPVQPTMVNPYGITVPIGPPGTPAPPMQPDRAKYANPYQPPQPPPDR